MNPPGRSCSSGSGGLSRTLEDLSASASMTATAADAGGGDGSRPAKRQRSADAPTRRGREAVAIRAWATNLVDHPGLSWDLATWWRRAARSGPVWA
jgi:hypothetical protein